MRLRSKIPRKATKAQRGRTIFFAPQAQSISVQAFRAKEVLSPFVPLWLCVNPLSDRRAAAAH
jgi:hypothetical protein